jgi:hypothetical protein
MAPDGPQGRSGTGAVARGVVLIVVGVVLAVLLLRATDSSEPFQTTSSGPSSPAGGTSTSTTQHTGAAAGGSTTTAVPAKAHDPAQVTVLVANGSGVSGAAGKVATTLKGSNYVTLPSVNTTSPASASVVYYVPGYEADAKAVAALLKPVPGTAAMPTPPPVANLQNANVVVVVAADLAK